MIKIISWNVNGIRACLKKDFLGWFKSFKPDILGLQEIKSRPDQIEKEYYEVVEPQGYFTVWNPGERAGYSGTIMYSNLATLPKPDRVIYDDDLIDLKKYGYTQNEGRVIGFQYLNTKPKVIVFNIYFPNGQMSEERLKYKMLFYEEFLISADKLAENGENLIIIGDLNTAHKEIDLKNPKENENRSGFLPQERAWIDKFISHGYIDTFRVFHPNEPDQYSWWTYRFNARAKNIGWRIDYVFINDKLLPYLKDGFILKDVMGSDHCPVGVVMDINY